MYSIDFANSNYDSRWMYRAMNISLNESMAVLLVSTLTDADKRVVGKLGIPGR